MSCRRPFSAFSGHLRGPGGRAIRNGHSFGAYVNRVCDNVICEWIPRRRTATQPIDDDDFAELSRRKPARTS